ncbi:MAG TPA: adenylate/guanylate cyclase domain-containing protein [Stellaceae bacterium]|nr:adenylate/guanylate cyclase domain-containing protein [Stellaceae bacterium]
MEHQRVQRRLTAIVAADVAGYSRLTGEDEEGTIARLRGLRREVVDPAIAAHGGRVVKTTGDGVLIEFASVVDAVRCAVIVQQAILARNGDAQADKCIKFRLGIHLGDVVVEGDDLLGDGVNVAARLEVLAEPGGICLSEDAYRQVARNVDVQFVDLGQHRLKNIVQPMRVYSVVMTTARSNSALRLAGASVPRMSFVVLPFADLSDHGEHEYFADGLTDDLTTDLSQWRDTFVIARSTAFAYKKKAVDVKSIGNQLRVAHVVQGSVRRSKDRIRVGVQLIDTESGGHLWADRFDRDVTELLELQDEITGRIAMALHYKMTEVESRRAQDQRSNDPDARDLQFRGWAALYRPASKAMTAEARGFFERSLAIDDCSAVAWAGLSTAHTNDLLGRWSDDPVEQLHKAEAAAARALACDPESFLAHLAKAAVLFVQGRLEAAFEEYAQVVELDRHRPIAYARMGVLNALLGRPEETFHLVERAIRLSPRDAGLGEWYAYMGIARFMLDQLDEAIFWLRRSTEAGPGIGINLYPLAAAFALVGRDQEAQAMLSEYRRQHPTMSIDRMRTLPYSSHPRYLAWRERLYDGLRKAGLPAE